MNEPNKYRVLCVIAVDDVEAYTFEEAYRKVGNMVGRKGFEVVDYSNSSVCTEQNNERY